MPQNYDRTDLTWSSRADLVIGHNGDIMDTYDDPLRSLYQEVRTRIMSALGDWVLYPDIAANIDDFVGEPNTKPTAEAIKTRVVAAVTRNGLVHSSDVDVKYSPIDVDKIMLRISIAVAPTALNGGSNYLGLNFLYDYSENRAYFVHFRS